MKDNERVVHQGMGWFLREAWKLQKEPTESYLLKYKDVSPRLIFQYACEKMTADNKLRFKKSK
jgi:3-methyladenine DNA glycosylase AlkD